MVCPRSHVPLLVHTSLHQRCANPHKYTQTDDMRRASFALQPPTFLTDTHFPSWLFFPFSRRGQICPFRYAPASKTRHLLYSEALFRQHFSSAKALLSRSILKGDSILLGEGPSSWSTSKGGRALQGYRGTLARLGPLFQPRHSWKLPSPRSPARALRAL